MAGPELYLEVVSGVMEGTKAEFTVKKKVTIGRTRVNAFQIKHDTVSQRHAFIAHKNGQWFVTDSGSSNGTSINGVFVTAGVPTELGNGDILGIGPDNEVKVMIIKIEDEEKQENTETEAKRGDEEMPSCKPTLKEWFEQGKERSDEECGSRAEATIRELEQESEALKKKICAAAGVDYMLISLKPR